MNREQAVKYLSFSGFSDEQIKAIEGAFTCDECVYSTSEGCQYDDITETIPPFDDCIRRQSVIDCFKKWQPYMATRLWEFEKELSALPSVTPQPKMGHWIRITDKTGHLVWECDKCEWQQRYNTNFCPDCGAKMEAEENG